MSDVLSMAGWTARHVLRHPLAWLWLGLAVTAWPVIAALAPVGLTGGSALETGLIYEVAFMGSCMGTLVGCTLVERGAWLLAGRPPWTRLTLELGALGAASSLLVLPPLTLPWLLGSGELTALPARLLLCQLHLSALGLLLLRMRLNANLRAIALGIAVWLLPALLDPETFAGRFVDSSLAAGQVLLWNTESVLAGPVWKERLAPIIGLICAASLLRPPPAIHALRHPR